MNQSFAIYMICKVALGAMLLTGAGTDLARRRIPNVLIAVGLGIFAITTVILCKNHETELLAGRLLAGALSFLVHLIPWLMHGMGAGDVKLALVIGLLSGWADWLGFLGVYSIVLLLASGALLALGKRKPKTLPLAPFMAAAWFLYQITALWR
jgi:Flp pilus assembly protein protease CpaA